MQSSTSTSIHETHATPFNTVNRRTSSYTVDLQESSPAGRPFAFVPKRKFSSATQKQTPSEDNSAFPSPVQGQIRLVETAPDETTTPQTMPRSFCTFPRIKPELSRGRLPQTDAEVLGSTPPSDTYPEMDISGSPALSSSDQPDALSLTNITGMPTMSHPASAAEGSGSIILLRKKSGELVKPSLKSTGFAAWATSTTARARTKSAPTTPMGSKSVHFDAHLEHVKLFLSEQKPLAVSRDGSPTETSEGDTTDTNVPFPRITGVTLRIKPMFLLQPPPEPWTFDVRLEKLSLEDTALVGTVLVRNIAFIKWVAVRFTLDNWLTTSEVAAHHITSLRGNTFDRFKFRVRLLDYMNGIEFKRLIFCVRFSVEGRQMWDSNGGKNYEVGFEKVRADPARQIQPPSLFGPKNAPALVTDLRKQLEKVVQNTPRSGSPTPTSLNRKNPRGIRVWLGDLAFGDDDDDDDPTPPFRPRSPPLDDQKKSSGTSPLSNKDVPLSARYDFGASLRRPNWIPSQVLSMPSSATPKPRMTQRRPRSSPPALTPTVQFPTSASHRRSLTLPSDGSPTSSPRESGSQGSPRDAPDSADGLAEEHRPSQGDDTCEEDKPRRHTRGWARSSSKQISSDSTSLKKTPPGMPTVTPPTPPRQEPVFHSSGDGSNSSSSCSPSVSPSTSCNPLDTVWGTLPRNDDEFSISTPSISTSPSPPITLSPLSPREELPRAASDDNLAATPTPGRNKGQRPPINSNPYHSFLDQFCFFTGVTNHYPHLNNTVDGTTPRRVQSASTVEDYFSRSPSHYDDVQSPGSTAGISTSNPTKRMRSAISPDFTASHGLMTSSH